MQTKNTRVDIKLVDELKESKNFPQIGKKQGGVELEFDLSNGVDTAITFYLETRKYSLARIKGHFTREELVAIIASLNGTMFEFQHTTYAYPFLMHLEDAVNLEHIDKMYGCDKKQLFKKSEELSDLQTLILQHEISLFWSSGRDLEEFVNLLC